MSKRIYQIEPWITPNESRLMSRYLHSDGWLTEFKETEKFEKCITDLLGVRYAVATTSGTVALFIGLKALGIGRGDEVIVPNYTMIATPNAVLLAGAKPVFVDVEKETLCMDIEKLPITTRTKAIMHVSINGRSGNIEKLRRLCKKRGVYLIEDACQSLSSKYNGKYLGTFGEIGCFSLSPHKIITTGQGGILVTNRKDLYAQIKRLKDFGRLRGGADWHESVGYNFKFTDLQSVIGIAQMSNIRERVKKKKAIFRLYRKLLSNVQGIEFFKTDLMAITPWCADILVPANKRDKLIQYLSKHAIGSRAFYPAIHFQPIFKKNSGNSYPISAELSKRGLWLPSAMQLRKRDITHVCKVIKDYFYHA